MPTTSSRTMATTTSASDQHANSENQPTNMSSTDAPMAGREDLAESCTTRSSRRSRHKMTDITIATRTSVVGLAPFRHSPRRLLVQGAASMLAPHPRWDRFQPRLQSRSPPPHRRLRPHDQRQHVPLHASRRPPRLVDNIGASIDVLGTPAAAFTITAYKSREPPCLESP